jgi:hypothetical protein
VISFVHDKVGRYYPSFNLLPIDQAVEHNRQRDLEEKTSPQAHPESRSNLPRFLRGSFSGSRSSLTQDTRGDGPGEDGTPSLSARLLKWRDERSHMILDTDPAEIARQLTLIESNFFRNVSVRFCHFVSRSLRCCN